MSRSAGPVTLRPTTVILAVAVGLGVTLVSSLGPAIRSQRIKPMAALALSHTISDANLHRRLIVGGWSHQLPPSRGGRVVPRCSASSETASSASRALRPSTRRCNFSSTWDSTSASSRSRNSSAASRSRSRPRGEGNGRGPECAEGALKDAVFHGPYSERTLRRAMRVVIGYISEGRLRASELDLISHHGYIVRWNDAKGRAVGDVLRMLDRLAAT